MFRFAALLVVLSGCLPAADVLWQRSVNVIRMALGPDATLYVLAEQPRRLIHYDASGNVLAEKQLSWFGTADLMTVDAQGNVLLAGTTGIDNQGTPGTVQPTRNATGRCLTPGRAPIEFPCSDAIVAKFDPNGNLLFASYLGGPGQDTAAGLATDAQGNIYLAGTAIGGVAPVTFPLVNGVMPGSPNGMAFVAKFSPDGARLIYSSGINGAGGSAELTGLAVDASGAAYIVGRSVEAFPTTPGSFGSDCHQLKLFVAKLSANGQHVETAGCFGVWQSSFPSPRIALGPNGNIYVASGTCCDPAFPPGFTSRILIATFSADLSATLLETYLPGTFVDTLRVAADGRLLLAARSGAGFPIRGAAENACLPPQTFATSLAVVLELTPDGRLVYSSAEPVAGDVARVEPAPDGGIFVARNSETIARAQVRRIANLENPAGVTPTPRTALNCLAHAATLERHDQRPASAGQLLTIFGVGIGPETPAIAQPDSRRVLPTEVAGTRVLVNGIPAPLLYVEANQINVQLPSSLAGAAEAEVVIEYQGVRSPPVRLPLAAQSAGLFQYIEGVRSGTKVVNDNGVRNESSGSRDSYAPHGTGVTVWLTGVAGASLEEGQLATGSERITTPVSAQFTYYVPAGAGVEPITVPATVADASLEPGTVGVARIRVLIPESAPAFRGGTLALEIGSRRLETQVSVGK